MHTNTHDARAKALTDAHKKQHAGRDKCAHVPYLHEAEIAKRAANTLNAAEIAVAFDGHVHLAPKVVAQERSKTQS